MENTKILENSFAKTWIEDGIIIFSYKPGIMDLNCAIESVKLRMQLSQEDTYPFLSDTRALTNVTKEARDYFASDIGVKQVSASAILFRSATMSLIGNFFLKINKPDLPVKLFTSYDEAKKWLSQFSKK